jgi:hypothetical protein
MAEMFTLQRLQIPESLHKCLASTNLIESPQSGVRRRTQNVSRWRDAAMVERWVASAWLLTEKHFRRLDGYRDLGSLAAILGREIDPAKKGKQRKMKSRYLPPSTKNGRPSRAVVFKPKHQGEAPPVRRTPIGLAKERSQERLVPLTRYIEDLIEIPFAVQIV